MLRNNPEDEEDLREAKEVKGEHTPGRHRPPTVRQPGPSLNGDGEPLRASIIAQGSVGHLAGVSYERAQSTIARAL
jgi:hypothetical protein